MPATRTIPVCRSPFLQDVTIALGRRSLKSLRQAHSMLEFEARKEEVDGVFCERLDVEARTVLRRMTKIAIWENATSWVYCRERITNASRPRVLFETHASLAGMDAEDVAELLRATLRDLESVKHVWQERAISNS